MAKRLTELQNFGTTQIGREMLAAPPYNLDIRYEKDVPGHPEGVYLYKYNQILSNMSLRICQEARGIVLDAVDGSIVSRGFDKFFNHGEANASPIDFRQALFMEKIDGSIIKIASLKQEICELRRENVLVSTNGTIFADNAELPISQGEHKSFGDLVWWLLENKYPEFTHVDPNVTYIFELVSKHNRVVVPYREYEDGALFFLGIRNNINGVESLPIAHELDGVFPTPRTYTYSELKAAYYGDRTATPEGAVRAITNKLEWTEANT
ncbi:MAG: T4 RnlA family RNA ligase [Actinobacteria bacterium]|nr:T4 RnlA family RNA ligase [Actinomycetota bacterium]